MESSTKRWECGQVGLLSHVGAAAGNGFTREPSESKGAARGGTGGGGHAGRSSGPYRVAEPVSLLFSVVGSFGRGFFFFLLSFFFSEGFGYGI